jgi:DnaD/phage-associated family protein
MAANYWIKLYHEILDDYKMHKLPDNVWRRAIEMFLLAGDMDQEGALPELEEIAFRLRVDPDQLAGEVEQLKAAGLLIEEDGQLYVKNFSKRQSAVTPAERMKQHRQRKRNEDVQGGVTECDEEEPESVTDCVTFRNTDTDTDKKQNRNRKEPEQDSADVAEETDKANIFELYENEIGALTPLAADALKCAQEDFPDHWIREALRIAAKNNKRSWSYAESILKRWRVEGFQVDNRQGRDSPPGGGSGRKNGGNGSVASNLDKFIHAEGIL